MAPRTALTEGISQRWPLGHRGPGDLGFLSPTGHSCTPVARRTPWSVRTVCGMRGVPRTVYPGRCTQSHAPGHAPGHAPVHAPVQVPVPVQSPVQSPVSIGRYWPLLAVIVPNGRYWPLLSLMAVIVPNGRYWPLLAVIGLLWIIIGRYWPLLAFIV